MPLADEYIRNETATRTKGDPAAVVRERRGDQSTDAHDKQYEGKIWGMWRGRGWLDQWNCQILSHVPEKVLSDGQSEYWHANERS